MLEGVERLNYLRRYCPPWGKKKKTHFPGPPKTRLRIGSFLVNSILRIFFLSAFGKVVGAQVLKMILRVLKPPPLTSVSTPLPIFCRFVGVQKRDRKQRSSFPRRNLCECSRHRRPFWGNRWVSLVDD